MLLTSSNSLYVSNGCLLLTVYFQGHIISMETDSACSYIHLEVNKSSLKDLSNTMFKVRFYERRIYKA
jgi:hypothetical protein